LKMAKVSVRLYEGWHAAYAAVGPNYSFLPFARASFEISILKALNKFCIYLTLPLP
jgi:hypothetical protein